MLYNIHILSLAFAFVMPIAYNIRTNKKYSQELMYAWILMELIT